MSREIRPYLAEYKRQNGGEVPTPNQVIAAFPERNWKRDSVKKVIARWKDENPDKIDPSVSPERVREKYAPSLKNISEGSGLEARLENTRVMLRVLEEKGAAGDVDAQSYERLVKQERQILEWMKRDADAAAKTVDAEFLPPTLEEILVLAAARKESGEADGGPRDNPYPALPQDRPSGS